MGRKANRGDRCSECKMKSAICICQLIHPLETKTFVTILMHFRERRTTTNTARLAHHMLPQSEIVIRGLALQPLVPENILRSEYSPIYLYPSSGSRELTPEFLETFRKPIQLIVPDGSWRQTKRMSKREPFLKSFPHCHLKLDRPSLFSLRRRVLDEGMSTVEAIARALGIIESVNVQNQLEDVFRIMVERTLQSRGQKNPSEAQLSLDEK